MTVLFLAPLSGPNVTGYIVYILLPIEFLKPFNSSPPSILFVLPYVHLLVM